MSAGGAELLLLAFCFRQDQLLFFLLPLLIWPIFSLALIAFVRKKILARIWICPNCGSRLPLTCSPFSVIIEYVASCPACGANLETESLPSEIPETDDEDGKELPSTVTLLVTPEQSKVLAELEEEGTIHLTLVYRGSKENAEKFLTAQDDVLLELYPPEPDPEEASQEETTQEETPTGTDNPEETEVETPTESEEVA